MHNNIYILAFSKKFIQKKLIYFSGMSFQNSNIVRTRAQSKINEQHFLFSNSNSFNRYVQNFNEEEIVHSIVRIRSDKI